MLKLLTIKNFVLVEEASISFQEGFTTITGETGSGKTVLIDALRLSLGQRADPSKVRKGADKALISASFEGNQLSSLSSVFDQSGIPFSSDEPLILSREVSAEGKSRAFVCGHPVPLSFLSQIAPLLIDFVGQHAQILLKESEEQRRFLDLYGNVDPVGFRRLWEEEKALAQKLALLQEKRKAIDPVELEEELDELKSLNFSPQEEETLVEELSLLANAGETAERLASVVEQAEGAMALCAQLKALLATLPLAEGKEMAQEAHLQLDELKRLAQSFSAKCDSDPHRLTFLEERLALIEKCKKKFGKDLNQALERLETECSTRGELDLSISETRAALLLAKKNTEGAAIALSEKRRSATVALAEELSQGLKALNIPVAKIQIELSKAPRSAAGEDRVEFLLQANQGEPLRPIKESSSGGELSRLLLCLKLALAEKQGAQTLIFDEIDANIGGETATLIGEKMTLLAQTRQILCITHFPQVARCGQHHVRVSKEQRGTRTICLIESLRDDQRHEEFLRMAGGVQMMTNQ